MRCYTGQHRFYAGVDLYARTAAGGGHSSRSGWVLLGSTETDTDA